MKEDLLPLLCDPETGADLQLTVAGTRNGEIWEGTLHSQATGHSFPIYQGIPRFVPRNNYAASFGLQWNRFSQVQLDSSTGATYSRERFDAETGWADSELNGKWVLDGGCGAGRFAEIAAKRDARVIALDYSSAVDAAAANLASFPNVHFVQGNLLQPPVRPASLSFVYSIGVLQHTPDPLNALAATLRLLHPGGQFAFTAYGRHWYTRLHSKYLLRPLTRRLPPEVLLRLVEGMMPFAFPVTEVLFSVPGVRRLAQFAIPIANYTHKSQFTPEQRYREAILDTFDMLSPAYDNPLKAAEVEQVFRRMNITDYRFQQRVPVIVTGSIGATDARHNECRPEETRLAVHAGGMS